MKRQVYTDEELLIRVWDREDIQDIMNLRAYYSANEERCREINELWVTEEKYQKSASFGKNWGFYTGIESIRNYYVVEHQKKMESYLEAYCATRPEIKKEKENLGYGYMTLQPISAPSIQIATDGKTAKGLWYSIGHQEVPQKDSTVQAHWTAMKIAADFVKEEKTGWHIWHLLEISDSYWEPGINYHDEIPVFEDSENDLLRIEFGKPDIEIQTHDRQFCWADNYPSMPEPYVTFTDEISWGPEGFKPMERWGN